MIAIKAHFITRWAFLLIQTSLRNCTQNHGSLPGNGGGSFLLTAGRKEKIEQPSHPFLRDAGLLDSDTLSLARLKLRKHTNAV